MEQHNQEHQNQTDNNTNQASNMPDVVTITFLYNQDFTYESVVSFAQQFPTYITRGEGKEQKHGVAFQLVNQEIATTAVKTWQLVEDWEDSTLKINKQEATKDELSAYRDSLAKAVSEDTAIEQKTGQEPEQKTGQETVQEPDWAIEPPGAVVGTVVLQEATKGVSDNKETELQEAALQEAEQSGTTEQETTALQNEAESESANVAATPQLDQNTTQDVTADTDAMSNTLQAPQAADTTGLIEITETEDEVVNEQSFEPQHTESQHTEPQHTESQEQALVQIDDNQNISKAENLVPPILPAGIIPTVKPATIPPLPTPPLTTPTTSSTEQASEGTNIKLQANNSENVVEAPELTQPEFTQPELTQTNAIETNNLQTQQSDLTPTNEQNGIAEIPDFTLSPELENASDLNKTHELSDAYKNQFSGTAGIPEQATNSQAGFQEAIEAKADEVLTQDNLDFSAFVQDSAVQQNTDQENTGQQNTGQQNTRQQNTRQDASPASSHDMQQHSMQQHSQPEAGMDVDASSLATEFGFSQISIGNFPQSHKEHVATSGDTDSANHSEQSHNYARANESSTVVQEAHGISQENEMVYSTQHPSDQPSIEDAYDELIDELTLTGEHNDNTPIWRKLLNGGKR